MLMIAGIFFGNSVCKGVNEATDAKLLQLERVHNSTFIEQIEDGTITQPPRMDIQQHLTFFESVCRNQQKFLGQMGIAVLLITVMKQLVPSARNRGIRKV